MMTTIQFYFLFFEEVYSMKMEDGEYGKAALVFSIHSKSLKKCNN